MGFCRKFIALVAILMMSTVITLPMANAQRNGETTPNLQREKFRVTQAYHRLKPMVEGELNRTVANPPNPRMLEQLIGECSSLLDTDQEYISEDQRSFFSKCIGELSTLKEEGVKRPTVGATSFDKCFQNHKTETALLNYDADRRWTSIARLKQEPNKLQDSVIYYVNPSTNKAYKISAPYKNLRAHGNSMWDGDSCVDLKVDGVGLRVEFHPESGFRHVFRGNCPTGSYNHKIVRNSDLNVSINPTNPNELEQTAISRARNSANHIINLLNESNDPKVLAARNANALILLTNCAPYFSAPQIQKLNQIARYLRDYPCEKNEQILNEGTCVAVAPPVDEAIGTPANK